MKLPCLLFFISVSINGCAGGDDGEESKPKKLRVEQNNFFIALVHREKERSTSKKKRPLKLDLVSSSVTDLEVRREYERLVKIYTKAVDEKWNYRTTPDAVPPGTPCLATLGLTAEKSFIQFCVSAAVEVENDLYTMVTSAICAHMLDHVGGEDDERTFQYHHPYTSGLDPNIAIAVANVDGSSLPPSARPLLRLPSEDDGTVKGTVAWCVAHYENRHEQGEIPIESYIVPGEIDDSPGSNRTIFRVKINSKKRIPARDLGGSPFYVRDAQDRPVLKGIRTLLAGDQFTAIAPFADWIRQKAREMKLE